ncbi:MAG: photosystem II protein Y [Cyanobacteriota bacterium]|nr:photosystem II protein Y [Cyanobacteriota bacterium]
MDIDFRPVIVLGPIILVVGWAAFNIAKAAIKGEAKLFGEKGNNPFA